MKPVKMLVTELLLQLFPVGLLHLPYFGQTELLFQLSLIYVPGIIPLLLRIIAGVRQVLLQPYLPELLLRMPPFKQQGPFQLQMPRFNSQQTLQAGPGLPIAEPVYRLPEYLIRNRPEQELTKSAIPQVSVPALRKIAKLLL